jgi:hypothetical protein
MEYIKQEDVHSILEITFKEFLLNVWEVINNNINKEEILKVLNLEMNDSICKCFTGRISRLINCLNGYDDRVNINMADNEQICNIIYLVKQKLEDKHDYNIEEHKRLVELEMLERGYTRDIVNVTFQNATTFENTVMGWTASSLNAITVTRAGGSQSFNIFIEYRF